MNIETKGGEPADERAALLAEAKEIAAATGSKDVRAFAESVAELLQSKACASVGVEPDLSVWEKSRFGVFHEDGRFEELGEDDPCGEKHPLGHTSRWVGGRHDMQLLRAALASPAPVAQWQIKNGGQWCNVDREPEEVFKAKLPVRALYERPIAAPAAAVPESPADPLRVACVTLDGSTLTVPVAQLGDVLHGEDDQHTYTLTLKTMTRTEFDALGEFNGF